MEAGGLVADDHGELVGAADGSHRVHRAVGEVAVRVDLDGSAVEWSADHGVGQRVTVGIDRTDIAGDQSVFLRLDHRCDGGRLVEELPADPGQ
jgi:hypothetical protein